MTRRRKALEEASLALGKSGKSCGKEPGSKTAGEVSEAGGMVSSLRDRAVTKLRGRKAAGHKGRLPDDPRPHFEACHVPEFGPDGSVVSGLVNPRDVTRHWRHERIMEARLRLLEFAATESLEKLLVATLDEAEALTDSRAGYYHLVEADQKTLALQAWSTRTVRELCQAKGKGRHYDLSEAGLWADCIRERRLVIHNDYAAHPRRKGLPHGHAKVTRDLAVPVFRANRIVAILGVGNKPSNYDDADIEAVAGLADLAWDITERMRAEQAVRSLNESLEARVRERTADLERANIALRQSEEELRLTWQCSLDGMRLTDDAGRLRMVNAAFCQMMQKPREELEGRKMSAPYLAAHAADILRKHRQRFQDRSVAPREQRSVTLWNGQQRILELSNSFLERPGQPTLLLSLYRDITEAHTATGALRESEARFRAIFESAPWGIATIGPEGRYLRVNRAYSAMLGRSETELRALGPAEVTHPEDVAEGRRLFAEVVAGRQDGYAHEKRLLRQDGGVVIAHVSVTGVRAASGSLRFVLSMALDLTEGRRVQQELLDVTSQERRRFSQDLHDGLGQYLGALALKAKCLEEDLLATQSEYATSAHLLRLRTEETMGQARGLARWLDPADTESGDVVSTLRQVAREAERLLGLTCTVRCKLPELNLNPNTTRQLRHIAQEALNNVSKHAQTLQVTLDLTLDAACLTLAIQDAGAGFTPGCTATDGLGLRTMRFRAEAIGAALTVKSGPSQGVRVTLILPASRLSKGIPK